MVRFGTAAMGSGPLVEGLNDSAINPTDQKVSHHSPTSKPGSLTPTRSAILCSRVSMRSRRASLAARPGVWARGLGHRLGFYLRSQGSMGSQDLFPCRLVR